MEVELNKQFPFITLDDILYTLKYPFDSNTKCDFTIVEQELLIHDPVAHTVMNRAWLIQVKLNNESFYLGASPNLSNLCKFGLFFKSELEAIAFSTSLDILLSESFNLAML